MFKVAWPSGLGMGLQNPLRRFNSARDLRFARVVELVYTQDLKFCGRNPVRVRVPPRALKISAKRRDFCFF